MESKRSVTVCFLAMALIFGFLFSACGTGTVPLDRDSFHILFPPVPVNDPVCDRPEYGDSLICERLKEAGFTNAEDAWNVILDANDISLVLEVYTKDQLAKVLDGFEAFLSQDMISYTQVFDKFLSDVEKADRVYSILKRRFAIFDAGYWMRVSDKQLLLLAIQNVRDTVGIK